MADYPAEKPSKSAAKRAHKARQKQIEQLCRISEEGMQALPFPERIADELATARGMKPSSARNRQIRHIASLISRLDEESLAEVDRLLQRSLGINHR